MALRPSHSIASESREWSPFGEKDRRATASGPSEDDAVDLTPEKVADLDELGVRLPASGTREERGDQDTDEDLF